MNKLPARYLILAAIILLSLIGGVIAVYTTANGPWGYTDPVAYISVARSLDHGQGLAYYEGNTRLTPISIHPPFYSIVLSLIGLFGVDLVAASRWFNILAFVASIFIAGWIFYRYSRTPSVGIIASALMCAFPNMVVYYSSAYSEPLFILSILAGGWAVLEYLRKQKWPWLVISALVTSTTPGTRYAGLAIVIAAGLTVLSFASGGLWSRLKKAALFSLIAGLPVLIWLVWVYFSSAHTVGGRTPDLQMAGLLANFQTFRGIFMDRIWMWIPFQTHETLLGYRLRFVMLGIIAAVIFVLSLLAERRYKKEPSGSALMSNLNILTFFGLSTVLFVAILILTYLFTQPTIDIDNRMLLPLYVSGVMMIYAAFASWQAAWPRGWGRVLQVLPWLMAVLCVWWYIPQTRDEVQRYHPGEGLTAYRWAHSSLIQAVRALPPDQPVISNDWELTMLWTDRPVYGLWSTFPLDPPLQVASYGTNPNDPFQEIFCSRAGALVIYADFPSQVRDRLGEAAQDQVAELFAGLQVYGKYLDGTIYLCH